MKNSFLFTLPLLLSILFSTNILAQSRYSTPPNEDCQLAAVFADRVNLREAANTKAKVLTKLKIGELVEVIERTSIATSIDGQTDFWFKVKTGYYTGYIWGGLLAKEVVKSENNPEVLFLLKTTNDSNGIRVKVIKNKVLQQDSQLEGLTLNEQLQGLETLGTKGVQGIKDLIAINYVGEFCGATSGQTILAWNGSLLSKFISIGSEGEAGYSNTERLVFPSDLQGEKNLIHYYQVEEEYQEDESGEQVLINENKVHIVYRWDGERLVEV